MNIDKKILQKIKLVVFDLDGTLLTDKNTILDETKELVTELKKFDVKFSFASGRLHSALTKHAETLDIQSPIISLDGSMIKENISGKIIFESYIKPRYIKKAIKLAEENLLNIALCHADAIFYTDQSSAIPSLTDKFGARFEEIDSYDLYFDNTLEVFMTGEYKEVIKKVRDKFLFPYSFGLMATNYKSHSYDVYNLEIRKQGSSKGTGLKRLAKYLGVGISETAVMGDWYNDRSLFETNALKIAVANAVPEIVNMADHTTTKDNNEGASAEFLELLLEAKKN